MKRKEIDEKRKELMIQYENLFEAILKEIEVSPFFPKEYDKEEIKECLDINVPYGLDIETVLSWACRSYRFGKKGKTKDFNNSDVVKMIKDCYELKCDILRLEDLEDMQKEFCGDIIITDPCYLTAKDSDWDLCECGENMEILGLNTYMVRDTLYGDWSCTTFNSDTGEVMGEFCADAGLVGVFLLDEVLKYNPEFDYHINRPWTTTLIKDFKGIVEIKVVHITGAYEDPWEDPWEDDVVEVHGHGVNMLTGEPINFIGRQTGL